MSSIFLSHNSQDKPFAKRLAGRLRANSVKVWIDEAEMKVGDSLVQRIEEGISGMEFLGVVLSTSSIDSEWVRKEVEMALTDEILSKKVKVLPILIEDCAIPGFLQGKVYADFRDGLSFQPQFERLLHSLGVMPRSRFSGSRAMYFKDFRRKIEDHFAPREVIVEFFEDGSGIDFIQVMRPDGTFSLYNYETSPSDDEISMEIFGCYNPELALESHAIPDRKRKDKTRELLEKYELPEGTWGQEWLEHPGGTEALSARAEISPGFQTGAEVSV